MNGFSLENLPVGWFDLIVVAVLITGALRGRKHGMSEELVPLIRWVSALAIAALCYRPIGKFIEGHTLMSLLTAYISAYLGCMLLVFILVSVLKRVVGGKPISGEKFGKSEYYLGVGAGTVTVVCMLICALSFLNARKFTTKEIEHRRAYEKDLYGSSFFPTLDSVQTFVFKKSFTGSLLKRTGSQLMIEPTVAKKKGIERKEWHMS